MAGLAGCIGGGGSSGGGSGTNGSGGNGGNEDVSMTLASAFAEGHVLVNGAAKRFKQIVENESGGKFQIRLAPGGSYGSSAEISELVAEGGVKGMSQGTFPFLQNAEDYYFFAMPWVMTDYEQIVRLHESELMDPAYEQLINQGDQRPLGEMVYRGGRMVYTKKNTGKINSPADAKSIPMRTPEIPPWVDIWAKVGIQATPVSWVEIYSAFQTGTVDAVEAPTAAFNSKKLFEIADIVNVLRSGFSTGNIYFNEGFYQGLDKTYQDLVQKAGDEATRHASEMARTQEKEHLKKFEDKGMTINDDINRPKFFNSAEPAINKLFEETWAPSRQEVENV